MRDRELRRIIGQVLVAAMPTLALTTACRTTGEANYVVRSNGRSCREACATLGGVGTQGSWRASDVMDCVEATELDPASPPAAGAPEDDEDAEQTSGSTPVAVCRMRTHYTGGIGRRPQGLSLGDATGARPEGAFFARVEQLERAAVLAFERTSRELRAHGAPPQLLRAVEAARREELAHVEIAARWRRHFGGVLGEVTAPPLHGVRPLVELACENASEGCVHEHWGAILAAAQAAGASDPALAQDLVVIARDEAGHAALSQRIDRWARARSSPSDRDALDRARARAVAEVAASIEEETEDLGVIGWPDRDARARLFAASRAAFGWREAA